MRITNTHIYFWGGFLSQWYKCNFTDNTYVFTSAEQYMMAKKASTFNDFKTHDLILKENNPKNCKALGRVITNYNEEVWKNIREDIIFNGNLLKFSQNLHLKNMLITTEKRVLVEASPYDKIYGVGLKETDDAILDERNWRGENLLGKCLMQVREQMIS